MNTHRLIPCLLALSLLLASCGPGRLPEPDTSPLPPQTPTPTGRDTTAPPVETLPVIFDDDGSPDGTTALFYLLGHPQVSIQAITISYGEAHPSIYIQHIGRKLDELGITTIPLGAGQDAPLAGSHAFPEWLRQSGNNFWGLPLPHRSKTYPTQDAASLMVSVINQAPEPVTLFVSGSCTNLAQALRLDPDIREKIAAVFIMGGAVHVPGNIGGLLPDSDNSVAEWNIYADPQAASEVFESGLDIYLVPLDATNQVRVGEADIDQWRAGGQTAGFAADIYTMVLNSWGTDSADIWDLMTAAIMVKPDLCRFQPLYLEVITAEDATSGQTRLDPDQEPNIHVCLEPDVTAIKQTLIDVFSNAR